jgi:hypothetical protein
MPGFVVLASAEVVTLDGAAAFLRARRTAREIAWTTLAGPPLPAQEETVAWLFPDPTPRAAARTAPMPREVAGDLDALVGPEPATTIVAEWGAYRRVRGMPPGADGRADERILLAGPVVVGPDGAPLVLRASGPRSVAELRARGYEPDAICRLLDVGPAVAVVYLDLERLDGLNREALFLLSDDVRRARIRAVLEAENLARAGDLDAIWEAVRPKIRRVPEVATFLRFLETRWRAPALSERERVCLDRFLASEPPGEIRDGAALRRAIERSAHDQRVPRAWLARLVRWALTSQAVAPPVDRVWDLLGAQEARRRLVSTCGFREEAT